MSESKTARSSAPQAWWRLARGAVSHSDETAAETLFHLMKIADPVSPTSDNKAPKKARPWAATV
jgi:hypothetical protein